MSEQSQGPGWWVASDGRWYPPDQSPLAPPPNPDGPPSGMATGTKVAVGVCVAVVVMVALGAAVILFGRGSDRSDAVAAPLTDAAPASFNRFTDPDGAFSFDLHPDWIALSLRGDVAGVGAKAAPGDSTRAALIDALVATLPRQVVFAAVDGGRIEGSQFNPNMNLIPVPRDGAGIQEIEAQAPLSVPAFGGTDPKIARITTRLGEGLRMTYRFKSTGPLAGVEGIQYFLFGDDTVWVLTVTSDDMATDRDHFEASASSFTLR